MSRAQVSPTTSLARQGNDNQQNLVEQGRSRDSNQEEEKKNKNYVSVVLSILSIVSVFGAVAMPKWTVLISTNGVTIGEYGLFIVKLLTVDDKNETSIVYQNLFEFFNPGELSLIICITIVLLFNFTLTVVGIIVSLGCCPIYLNFLAAFSIFNIFAVVNYFAVMGLWLWITERIPQHNLDDHIRTIYPEVRSEFGYGYYLIILCAGFLTVSAAFNILNVNLCKKACFTKKFRASNTPIINSLTARQILGRIRVQLPSDPPEYREQLSPETSPISPPTLPPHLANGNTFLLN